MSEQLVIDPARFARDGARLTGALVAATLPRLSEQLQREQLQRADPLPGADQLQDADLLQGAGGEIGYRVEGFLSERGHPGLHLQLDGEIELRCQRCLGALRTRIESRRDIVLVPGADEFAQRSDEDETLDIIPAAARLDLRALLEDEVLLALPVAPCHAPGECRVPEGRPGAAPERVSPFAALAQLKR
jgi:uncharacterized protein